MLEGRNDPESICITLFQQKYNTMYAMILHLFRKTTAVVLLAYLFCLSLHNIVSAADYETPSPGNASDYLSRPSGVNDQLDARVRSDGFINQYRLLDAGNTEIAVRGTDFANERLHELDIINGIIELKKTDAYVEGSASSLDRAAIENAKRRLAVEFAVDPYSSNEALQKLLEDLALAIIDGGMTLDIGLQGTASGVDADTRHYLLYAPNVLTQKIREHLAGSHFPAEKLDALLSTTRCSPRHAVSAAAILLRLDLQKSNQAIFSWLLEAKEENECRRRLHMLELAWDYRRRKKISRLWVNNDQLYWRDSVNNEGIAIVADHLFWTRKLENLLDELESIYKVAWVSGQASKRAASELGNRGITLSTGRFNRLKDRAGIGNILLEGSKLPELEGLPVEQTLVTSRNETPAADPVESAVEEAQTPVSPPEPEPIPAPESVPDPTAPEMVEAVTEEKPATEKIIHATGASEEMVQEQETRQEGAPVAQAPVLQESTPQTPATREPEPVPAKPAACWEYPGLGRFILNRVAGEMELTHEIIANNESRNFKLRTIGKQYFWNTSNVVHVFTSYKKEMTLSTNIYNNKKDFPLTRCKQ